MLLPENLRNRSIAKSKPVRTPLSNQEKIDNVHSDYIEVFLPASEVTIKSDLPTDFAEKALGAVTIVNVIMDGVHIDVTFDPRMDAEKLKHLQGFCAKLGHFKYRVGRAGSWIEANGLEDVDETVVGEVAVDEGQTDVDEGSRNWSTKLPDWFTEQFNAAEFENEMKWYARA